MEEVNVHVSINRWSAMMLNHKIKRIQRSVDAANASIEKCQAKIKSARSALEELAVLELVVNVD